MKATICVSIESRNEKTFWKGVKYLYTHQHISIADFLWLTHLFSILHFYTTWKHQKVFSCYRGYKMCNILNNRLNSNTYTVIQYQFSEINRKVLRDLGSLVTVRNFNQRKKKSILWIGLSSTWVASLIIKQMWSSSIWNKSSFQSLASLDKSFQSSTFSIRYFPLVYKISICYFYLQ